MQLLETPPAITATMLFPPKKRKEYVASLLTEKRQATNEQALLNTFKNTRTWHEYNA